MAKNISCKTITLVLAIITVVTGFFSYVNAGGDFGFIKASIFGLEDINHEKDFFLTRENIDQYVLPADKTEDNELVILKAKKSEIEF